jgi:threonylcarbamoyladenosine tRNA methylthiotransferase MtaB
LLARLPVTYLHVFPYSPRPGTPAACLTPLANGRQVQLRAQELRRLGEQKKRAFYGQHVGQVVEVLVEGEVPGRPGWVRGWTPNYLRVHLPGHGEWANRFVPVRLQEVRGQVLVGLPLE